MNLYFGFLLVGKFYVLSLMVNLVYSFGVYGFGLDIDIICVCLWYIYREYFFGEF